jgi:hypothetical protein
MHLPTLAARFFDQVATGAIEIYNEFSLQHEFGILVREAVAGAEKVQFERPIQYFGLTTGQYEKKEIDLSIFSSPSFPKAAVEFKFPRRGQHPEQMFSSCIDIRFLEQLTDTGFKAGFFIMVVDDRLFYEGRDRSRIYQFFRAGVTLHGHVSKPTGAKDHSIDLRGSYDLKWQRAGNQMRWLLVEVHP